LSFGEDAFLNINFEFCVMKFIIFEYDGKSF